jgi:hypothetical protein
MGSIKAGWFGMKKIPLVPFRKEGSERRSNPLISKRYRNDSKTLATRVMAIQNSFIGCYFGRKGSFTQETIEDGVREKTGSALVCLLLKLDKIFGKCEKYFFTYQRLL